MKLNVNYLARFEVSIFAKHLVPAGILFILYALTVLSVSVNIACCLGGNKKGNKGKDALKPSLSSPDTL